MALSFFSSKIIHTIHQLLCILCLMMIILVYFASQCFSFPLQDPPPQQILRQLNCRWWWRWLITLHRHGQTAVHTFITILRSMFFFTGPPPLPPNSDLNNFYANSTVLALAVVNYTPSSWPGSRDYVYCYLIDTP